MIVSAILILVYAAVYLLTAPLRAFADVTAESGFGSAVSSFTHYIANLNGFLPVATIMTVLGLVMALEVILATYKIAMWVIRRIPTQS